MNIANGVRLSSANPMRQYGAASAGSQHATAWRTTASLRLIATSSGGSRYGGWPWGYRHPGSWAMPEKGGALTSHHELHGSSTLTAAGALGKNALADLAGSGVLSATGQLIVSAIANLAGSGTISAAGLLAVLQATAAITGSGALAADASALGWLLSDLAGSGTTSGVSYAVGNMEADITPFSELSPESLASAVWAAVAADNDDTGTMGEKLNDAGSASSPWTEVIEGSYTAAEMLRVIAAALAGELSGGATTTITIKGVDGTTDRIVATVTSDGDRTAVTLDGT